MISSIMICCLSVDTVKVIFDSLGQLSTLIVAVVGFITAIVVAKITGGLELKRMLCLKRLEAYEVAMRQLWHLITVYENILAAMAAINLDEDNSTIREKIELVLVHFVQLGELMKKNDDLAQIMFYSDLPTHDLIQVSKEVPRFVKMLKEVDVKLSEPMISENLVIIETKIKDGTNRLAPLIHQELNHLYNINVKLKNDVWMDKRLKFLFK